MEFSYSHYKIDEHQKRIERLLEIIPGALSWSILFCMGLLSFAMPAVAALIGIAFLLYWLLRLVYMNIFLILSYLRLAVEGDVNWMERVKGIDNINAYLSELCSFNRKAGIREKISNYLHCKEISALKISNNHPPLSGALYHCVIFTVAKEKRQIVEPGIQAIIKGQYPAKRVFLVIALEGSAPAEVKKDMADLQSVYQKDFFDFLVVIHPNNRAGEARVKGANATFAAKEAARYFEIQKIPHENVLVSCFDADTVAKGNYFSCLTYHFLVADTRTRTSFQPIPVYHNNIWEVPGFARIIDIGTSFFQLIEATNPRNLVTFSSHSMSLSTLVDVGYWPVDMISDDSAIFWKAFIQYDGEYRVTPMYTTVSMDIATGPNLWQTIRNIYRQKRRWAWGVENIPIVMRAFFKSSGISFYQKLSQGFKLFDTFISWATWSFLLTFVSWLPAVFSGNEFASSTIYYAAPRIRTTIISLASSGILICMIISFMLLPKRKTKQGFLRYVVHSLEWLLIPAAIVSLSALPALDAQTRLMLGRRMEFGVTEKTRKSA